MDKDIVRKMCQKFIRFGFEKNMFGVCTYALMCVFLLVGAWMVLCDVPDATDLRQVG